MAYQFPLNGGRINASVGGNSTSAGAGYSLISTGNMILAGGNNITLSQNGQSISIAGNGAGAGLSAGTQSVSTGTVNFANSNGVTFGMSGSSQITASHNGITSQSNQALSASNGSFAFQTAGFSNANGVTFGTSAGSIMTASVNTSYAASNHSHGNPTLNLTNISGTTASASNGLTLSLSAAAQTAQTQSNIQGIIAAGSTNRTGDISFANSNGVTFGLSNNTMTASVAAGGGGGVAMANSQTTYTSGTANLVVAGGAMTIASTTGQSFNFSVPQTSSLSMTGIVSASSNGNTISIGAPAFSVGMSTGGNTLGTTGTVSNQMIFAGGNNITLSQATGAGGNTLSIIGGAGGGGGGVALYDGVNSISSGTARLTVAGAMTASINGQTLSLSVPSQSSISGTGIISISRNAGTISIGAPAFSAGMSTGGNTLGTTGTVSNQIIFAGGNNITLSQATGAGGNTLSIAAASQSIQTQNRFNMTLSGNTTGTMAQISSGTLNLAGGSNITLSQNGNSVTIIGGSGGGGSSVTDQTLYVSGDGGQTTGWRAEGGDYTRVDDQPTDDGDTTRLYSVGANDEASFNIDNTVGITGTVNSVIVHAIIKALDPVASTFQIFVRIGGTNYYSGTLDTVTNNTSYIDFSYTWSVNPATSAAWTASEINSLEIGVKKINTAGLRLTQMFAIVNATTSSGGGGGIAVANSQTTYTSGTANFVAGSGAITINSTTGQSFQFNVPATSSLMGTNGINVSTTSNSIYIDGSGIGGGTLSNWEPLPIQYGSLSQTQKGNGSVYFYKLQPMAFVSATRMLQLVSISMGTSSNVSHAGVISIAAGIFSANGSTLSLITQSSGSTYYQWTNTSNNSMSVITGVQGATLPMSLNMTPGNYWIGMWSRTSFTQAASFSASNLVFTVNNSSYQGNLLQAPNATQGAQEGVGYYSATSSALPTNVAMSQITQSLFRSNAIPYMNFKNITW